MTSFNLIPDAYAILRSKGVYRQAKVYRRGDDVYAGHGSGFIRLMRDGTSLANVHHDEVQLGVEPEYDNVGRMKMPTERKGVGGWSK